VAFVAVCVQLACSKEQLWRFQFKIPATRKHCNG